MAQNIHAVRMFIRLCSERSVSDTFYHDVLGLPLLRRVGDKATIWWLGEAVVFEAIYVQGKVVVPEDDPRQAASLPIMRVADLDGLLTRLRAAGAQVTQPQPCAAGREAFVRDSAGYWMGLRERAPNASLPQDIEARRRARRGETFNPGCKSMPPDIQELGWIVRRVEDLARMRRFYQDVLGLAFIGEENGRPLFDCGDNVILELAAGGRASPPPKDRLQGSSILLFRVTEIAKLRASLAEADAHIVNQNVPLHWADLMYFADPEGGLLGAEQGYHPGTYAPEKFVLPEVLEIERRRLEAAAAERERLAAATGNAR
ncbi:MAG TPA: VOC family protein [Steroidobacteraceae bacterium]